MISVFYCRKEKSPQKLPKLPVKSPIKTPIKSPIRKQPEELVPPENEAEVHSPLTESPEQVVSVGAVLKNDLFCLWFYVLLANISLIYRNYPTSKYRLMLGTCSQMSFSCHTCCDMGTLIFEVSSEDTSLLGRLLQQARGMRINYNSNSQESRVEKNSRESTLRPLDMKT